MIPVTVTVNQRKNLTRKGKISKEISQMKKNRRKNQGLIQDPDQNLLKILAPQVLQVLVNLLKGHNQKNKRKMISQLKRQ